jgi:aromatic ring-opening dioxygenase LigB subunit
LNNDFGVYLNAAASGSAEIGTDLPTNESSYTVSLSSIPLSPDLTQQLLSDLSWAHQNVTGIKIPANQDAPLYWGEIIPLLLIPREQQGVQIPAAGRRSLRPDAAVVQHARHRRHFIWTHPLRRYDSAPDMIPELLRVGAMLGDWLESLPVTVGVVISGDLSHTHQSDGPYGYSKTAAVMDAAFGSWAASNPCQNANDLLVRAAALQDTAKSCGFTGFVLLHGMLCGDRSRLTHTPNWTSKVLVNRNATYFGMMVAEFTRV